MTKDLALKTQNIRGGVPQYKDKIGYVSAIYGTNTIIIDNFQGYGESYVQREDPEITITIEGITCFTGNFMTLREKLK